MMISFVGPVLPVSDFPFAGIDFPPTLVPSTSPRMFSDEDMGDEDEDDDDDLVDDGDEDLDDEDDGLNAARN